MAVELCNSDRFIDVTPTTPPKRVCIMSDVGTEVWALFGQDNLSFGRFTLKLGGRYSEEERTSSNPSVTVARNGLGPVITTTTEGSFDKKTFTDFTPEIGVEWRATDDPMVCYACSEGFKAGAGENAVPNPETAPLSAIVDPEEIRNHELGVKSTWFDNRLAVNVAAYAYDLEGQQINKTLASGPAGFTTIFENAAEVLPKASSWNSSQYPPTLSA